MRKNIYNYIVYRNGYSYWYNGLSHIHFKLTEKLGHKIERLLDTPLEIKRINKSFYNDLIKNKLIVEDDFDELDSIRGKNKTYINRKDYNLIVIPTLNCNFKCWYCIQDHIPSMMNQEVTDLVKRHISYMVNNEKISSLHIDGFGGEPLMYFNKICDISEYAINVCKNADIPFSNSATTNGYFLLDEIANKLERLQFNYFQITIDGCKENHDKVKSCNGCDSSFEHVLNNINKMMHECTNISVILRINYTENNLSERIVSQINDIISQEIRSRITILPKRIWQEGKINDFNSKTKEIWDSFKKTGYKLRLSNIIKNFIPCYVNKRYYNTINFNGKVLKCTACDDLYTGHRSGTITEIGNVEWGDNIDERFITPSYENKECLSCQYLPLCMGICPRDHIVGEQYGKIKNLDYSIEDSIIEEIDSCIGFQHTT
jgi:uncharacterized protein